MEIIITILSTILGAALGYFIGLRGKDAMRIAFEQERATLGAEVARFKQEALSLTEQRNDYRARSETAEKEASEAKLARATAEEREATAKKKVDEQATQLAELNTKLTAEFENIGNRILKQVSGDLTSTSETRIDGLLKPLRDKLEDFQKQVAASYDQETRDVLSLKTQIESIVQINKSLGTQADNLAKALKGDVKTAGRWGEMILERILEDSGLTEGNEYIRQGQGLGLKSADGGPQRPDVLVRFPEGRHMVVDSKVPLTHFDAYYAADDEIGRNASLNLFLNSVRSHIAGLAEKSYQDNDKLIAHDYVLLFIPIEGALVLALQSDESLFSYAWERRVVLVGPSTLMMTLKTVASIWRFQRQSDNAEKIAKAGADLHDKLVGFLEEMDNVGQRLDQAQASYVKARDRLTAGRGNVISRAKQMIELGVKAKKVLPISFSDKDQVDPDGDSEGGVA